MTTFADLGVRTRTLESLDRLGITTPLPVQERALPPLLAGGDVVVEAPTGSGKTLAFGLPLVERLVGPRGRSPRALIVVPTRELAAQIVAVLRDVDRGLRTALLVGGVGYGAQLEALRRTADIVVGCPGRILDLAARGELRLDAVEVLVLDEADEMLDQGFARDVERIIALCPAGPAAGGRRQTVLASATMPDWVQTMVDRHLHLPARVVVEREQEPMLEQGLLRVGSGEKVPTVSRLIASRSGRVIVFHRTKHGAKKLARDLVARGHRAVELQGNLSQNARDRAIGAFRSGEADVLVATNVAARGIDVEGVELVVNIELPDTAQWLTHRVGRTARNGREGTAVTLLSEEDMPQWNKLRRLGAPALRWVDGEALVSEGRIVPTDEPAPGAPATRRPAAATGPRSSVGHRARPAGSGGGHVERGPGGAGRGRRRGAERPFTGRTSDRDRAFTPPGRAPSQNAARQGREGTLSVPR